MVALSEVKASNSRIAEALPAGLVAVFIGGTSGIGEYALLKFAEYARQPRVYIVGRSQAAGERLVAECRRLNPDGGHFEVILADTSLLRNVDDVCRQLKAKEAAINVLFLTMGAILLGKKQTSEGLDYAIALAYHCRMRFAVNLLPQIRAAQSLRRVVTVLAGTKEGEVDTSDFMSPKGGMMAWRAHGTSMTTLALEELARRAPEVSFVHAFPGRVRSAIARDMGKIISIAFNVLVWLVGRWLYIPNDECGERQVFVATSARYPARGGGADGVAPPAGVAVARGSDGRAGSGVYTINQHSDNGPTSVDAVLASLREQGVGDKVWKHTVDEFVRVTGSAALE